MKLWRKLGKKEVDGSRTGRMIKQSFLMQEQALKFGIKSYPLLTTLLTRAGITTQTELQSMSNEIIEQINESKE
jgi:type III secretory pathway component EscS